MKSTQLTIERFSLLVITSNVVMSFHFHNIHMPYLVRMNFILLQLWNHFPFTILLSIIVVACILTTGSIPPVSTESMLRPMQSELKQFNAVFACSLFRARWMLSSGLTKIPSPTSTLFCFWISNTLESVSTPSFVLYHTQVHLSNARQCPMRPCISCNQKGKLFYFSFLSLHPSQ